MGTATATKRPRARAAKAAPASSPTTSPPRRRAAPRMPATSHTPPIPAAPAKRKTQPSLSAPASGSGRSPINGTEPTTLSAAAPGPEFPAIRLGELLLAIRAEHDRRRQYHSAEKRLTLQIKALLRSAGAETLEQAQGSALDEVLESLDGFRVEIARRRKHHEKALGKLAEELPVWPWAKDVRGIGALGLGQLVGECGDIGTYANPAKLWKRMGVAVIAGERQRKCKDAELALEHGYSPRRRAVLFNLGEALVKQNREGAYRTLYLERKGLEASRPPCPSCAKRKASTSCSPAHIHNRARRYMEKRFLVDLWKAWRQTSAHEAPRGEAGGEV